MLSVAQQISSLILRRENEREDWIPGAEDIDAEHAVADVISKMRLKTLQLPVGKSLFSDTQASRLLQQATGLQQLRLMHRSVAPMGATIASLAHLHGLKELEIAGWTSYDLSHGLACASSLTRLSMVLPKPEHGGGEAAAAILRTATSLHSLHISDLGKTHPGALLNGFAVQPHRNVCQLHFPLRVVLGSRDTAVTSPCFSAIYFLRPSAS